MNVEPKREDFFLPDALIWAFKVYSRNFITLLALAVTGMIPAWIYNITAAIPLNWQAGQATLMQLVSFVVAAVFYMAMIRAVADISEGVETSFSQLLLSGLNKLWPFLIMAFLVSIITALFTDIYWAVFNGFPPLKLLFEIIYWIAMGFFLIFFIFFPFVLVLKEARVKAALNMCWLITRTYFMRNFLGVLILLAVAAVATYPFLFIMVFFQVRIAVLVTVMGILGSFYMPFAVAYLFLIFQSYEKVVNSSQV